MGNLTLPNAVTSAYTYDDAGRLTLLAHTNLTGTLASYAYGLDQVGNRTTLTESLVTVDNLPDGTFLESGGLVVMEAEHFENRIDGDTHNWLLQTSVPGYTGTSYLQTSLDIDVLVQTNELTASPRAEYLVDFTTTGTYTVWRRGRRCWPPTRVPPSEVPDRVVDSETTGDKVFRVIRRSNNKERPEQQ